MANVERSLSRISTIAPRPHTFLFSARTPRRCFLPFFLRRQTFTGPGSICRRVGKTHAHDRHLGLTEVAVVPPGISWWFSLLSIAELLVLLVGDFEFVDVKVGQGYLMRRLLLRVVIVVAHDEFTGVD